jgi:outer membrane protein assembly factor BamB
MSNIYVYQDSFGSCLAIIDNVLVFLGGTDENDGVTLVGSDIETGAPRWKTDTRMMSTFAYDANHIYGDVNNGQVAAYDIMSGKIAWQVHLSRGNSILYTTATASDLYVEMIPAASYNLDLRTGGVKQTFSAFEGMPTFLIQDKIRFWKPRPESMQATNIETENTLWSAQFDGEIIQTPVFYEDFILVKTGRSTVGNIYVLDIATGEIIWQANLVASNISSSENVVYYLTTQAQLKAVDIRTGEMIGTIDFTPSLYELSPLDLSNRPFNVAAYDKTVVVYFGDSRQLFTFRFLPDG